MASDLSLLFTPLLKYYIDFFNLFFFGYVLTGCKSPLCSGPKFSTLGVGFSMPLKYKRTITIQPYYHVGNIRLSKRFRVYKGTICFHGYFACNRFLMTYFHLIYISSTYLSQPDVMTNTYETSMKTRTAAILSESEGCHRDLVFYAIEPFS